MFDDRDVTLRQDIIDECIKLKYFESTMEGGREYVRITIKGQVKLGEYIDNISREILKTKPSWITLFNLDKLSLIQNEILQQKFPSPEFALTEHIVEDRRNKLSDVVKAYIEVLEGELIELPPISPLVY